MGTPFDMSRKINCAGGFVSNIRGAVQFNEQMDIVDNPNIMADLNGIRNLSVTRRSYIAPPPMKTGKDPLPHKCSPSESGFTRPRATHTPDILDVFKVNRERSLMSSDLKDFVGIDCKVPAYMTSSETHEAFTKNILKNPTYDWKKVFTGNKESGFTHAYNPNTLDGRHLDPVWSGCPPEMGRVGPSVTHQDYLPSYLKSGKEFTLPLSQTGRTVTGFNRFKELLPCFADYSWKGPCRSLETSYKYDYPRKFVHCDMKGKEVIGKGFNISGNIGTLNLFDGSGFYISEAMERYVSPVPEGRRRHGNLRGAVDNFNQLSGFATGTKVQNSWDDPCRSNVMGDRTNGPLDPTRYNPWPRYLVGHRGMLDKNYRPHPIAESGMDYQAPRVENGSIFNDFSTLI